MQIICTQGFVLLALTTSLKSLRPTCKNGICSKASNLQLTLFYLSLYTIAISSGAVKPNMSTFGADQFDDFNPQEKKLKASFFNWWSFNTCIGILVATLLVVYIEERYGWGLGYGLSAIGFLLSFIIFFLGTPIYRHKARNTRSTTMDFIRVIFAAFRNRKLQLPSSPSVLHEFELQHYINSGRRLIYHSPHFRLSTQLLLFFVLLCKLLGDVFLPSLKI